MGRQCICTEVVWGGGGRNTVPHVREGEWGYAEELYTHPIPFFERSVGWLALLLIKAGNVEANLGHISHKHTPGSTLCITETRTTCI